MTADKIVKTYPRFRIEKRCDGFYAVQLWDGLKPLTARVIGPCKSEKQATWLASNGTTML